MKYTKEYLQLLQAAIKRAPDYGITRSPLIETNKISEAGFERANFILNLRWEAIAKSIPGYLGNRCIPLASKMFATLVAHGINAEIVIGNVFYHGESLYTCSVDSLMQEVRSPGGDDDKLSLHAWVSIGGDTIWDGSLFSKLVASKAAPEEYDRQFMGSRAGLFAERSNLLYHPLVVGSQFIALTNQTDPWIEMEAIKSFIAKNHERQILT